MGEPIIKRSGFVLASIVSTSAKAGPGSMPRFFERGEAIRLRIDMTDEARARRGGEEMADHHGDALAETRDRDGQCVR